MCTRFNPKTKITKHDAPRGRVGPLCNGFSNEGSHNLDRAIVGHMLQSQIQNHKHDTPRGRVAPPSHENGFSNGGNHKLGRSKRTIFFLSRKVIYMDSLNKRNVLNSASNGFIYVYITLYVTFHTYSCMIRTHRHTFSSLIFLDSNLSVSNDLNIQILYTSCHISHNTLQHTATPCNTLQHTSHPYIRTHTLLLSSLIFLDAKLGTSNNCMQL